MAGRVLREQIPNKAIILGSYFQTVNPIHHVECAPLFSCKCAYFKPGRAGQLPPRRLNDPAQMSPLLRSLPTPQGRAGLSSLLPRLFVPLSLWHSHAVFYLCLCLSSPPNQITHGRLGASTIGWREEGTGSGVKPRGFESWSEILSRPWTCYLCLCRRSQLKIGVKNTFLPQLL